jgi:hypothetical protein
VFASRFSLQYLMQALACLAETGPGYNDKNVVRLTMERGRPRPQKYPILVASDFWTKSLAF